MTERKKERLIMLYLLHFTECNFSYNDEPFTEDIIIETEMNRTDVDRLAKKIAEIKEEADSYAAGLDNIDTLGFDVPDYWDRTGWNEKIQLVTDYMESIDDFKIVDFDMCEAEVD